MDRRVFFTVLVAALGYFVDVYDLIIFSVVRVESLAALGYSGDDLTSKGVLLLNLQLGGMLAGGIFWGMLGDRRGRLSILFGSIILYSLANLANAFVTNIEQYALCRLLAGIGLAGEIGAGITLVAELLPKDKRGLGTTLVATLGVIGGFVAALTGGWLDWKTAYIVGGCMGLALLALRVAAAESGLFAQIAHDPGVSRGDLRLLFGEAACLSRFLRCTLIGMPIWFILGLIVTFSPEIGTTLGIATPLTSATAVLWFYGGIVLGDLVSGLFSQVMRSRRTALFTFILGSLASFLVMLNLPQGWLRADIYYLFCGLTGFFSGYWAVFLVTASESFGTNLRATVTTSVPNIVRGGAVILSSLFLALKATLGVTGSLQAIGLGVFAVALYCVWSIRETFGIDLAYIEKKREEITA
jgi:MFS family permease